VTVKARYVGHRINPSAFKSVFSSRTRGLGRDLDARYRRVLAAANMGVGVHTGTLMLTHRRNDGRTARGPYVELVAGQRRLTPYLGDHLRGTPPHTIRPRRRTALRFIVGGRVAFATRVRHPGTTANPYLQRALRAAR
jgi:hypothetical protein